MNQKLPQILGFGIILDIIILDQLTKWLAMEYFLRPRLGEATIGFLDCVMTAPERLRPVYIDVTSYFNLVMVWNEGVSFNMMQNTGPLILSLLAIGISSILAWWLYKSESKTEAIALGLIIGGALGNTIDRARFGAVADFLDFYVGTYHWPAFNLADSSISIGVAILLFHGFFMDKKKDK